jgi:hypothetical protein
LPHWELLGDPDSDEEFLWVILKNGVESQ